MRSLCVGAYNCQDFLPLLRCTELPCLRSLNPSCRDPKLLFESVSEYVDFVKQDNNNHKKKSDNELDDVKEEGGGEKRSIR